MLGQLGVRRPEVLVHAALGEDAAAIGFGDQALILTVDPLTGAGQHAGWYAVQVACNDVAAMGGAPIGVLVTLLMPESAEEADVAALMADVDRAARELNVEVLGGHTEVAPGVLSPIVVTTAVGRAPRDRVLASANARPGHDLVLTKAVGLEGTSILANDLTRHLRGRLDEAAIARAQRFIDEISVVPDGLRAAELGAAALHDPTEGGLLGAVWELAEAAGCGYELWAEAIPIRPETRAICAVFEADPLQLISSGALLAAAPDGPALASGLRTTGIEATVIGRLLPGDERVLVRAGRREPLGPVWRDELWRILDTWSADEPDPSAPTAEG